nr:MAG TPA: hypothetical protein [Caudoviricetes sp.]
MYEWYTNVTLVKWLVSGHRRGSLDSFRRSFFVSYWWVCQRKIKLIKKDNLYSRS